MPKDFFISYNYHDREIAIWIGHQLEEAGYSVVIHERDFTGNWINQMDEAIQYCGRTIAVLSPAYINAEYTKVEWAHAFKEDPKGEKDKLIPIRVADFEPKGILSQLVILDFVNKTDEERRKLLLGRLKRKSLSGYRKNAKRPFPRIALTSMIVVILLSIVGIQYFSAFSESFQLTIYIHGPKGKQDILLENKGKLIVDFDNDRRTAMIGENGRTNFGEIPKKFIDKEIGLGLQADGYELAEPDKKYKMDGRPIYISVKKDNSLGKISLTLKDPQGNPMEGAEILIGNDTIVHTDKYGILNLILPERMRVENKQIPYLLHFTKEGYMPVSEYYYTNAGGIEIRLVKDKK